MATMVPEEKAINRRKGGSRLKLQDQGEKCFGNVFCYFDVSTGRQLLPSCGESATLSVHCTTPLVCDCASTASMVAGAETSGSSACDASGHWSVTGRHCHEPKPSQFYRSVRTLERIQDRGCSGSKLPTASPVFSIISEHPVPGLVYSSLFLVSVSGHPVYTT
jgi:hypothetical protein